MHAFDVLGDPVRRRILELLADGELTSGAITGVVQAEFGISQPAVSQHLKVLRDSGFANVRPEGTRRLYTVDAAPFRELDDWLARFRAFWGQRLDSLETELARGKRERRLKAAASDSQNECLRDRRQQELGLPDRLQHDHEHSILEIVLELSGGLQREARLSDPTRTCESNEVHFRSTRQRPEGLQLRFTSDKRRGRRRQIRRTIKRRSQWGKLVRQARIDNLVEALRLLDVFERMHTEIEVSDARFIQQQVTCHL